MSSIGKGRVPSPTSKSPSKPWTQFATTVKEISRAHLLEPTNTDPRREVVRSHPAFADRCIYTRNDNEILCTSLAATP